MDRRGKSPSLHLAAGEAVSSVEGDRTTRGEKGTGSKSKRCNQMQPQWASAALGGGRL